MARTSGSPLIVDPDSKFIESIIGDAAAKDRPPITATTGKTAQLALADPAQAIIGLFLNLKTDNPPGISVIRAALFHRPSLPVFLLKDAEGPVLEPKDAKRLGIQKIVDKPITYRAILDLVAPRTVVFDAAGALAKAKEFKDGIDQEIKAEDAEFVPVIARNFLSGNQSYFDLYVRLSSGRYVKILQAGDVFNAERLKGYLEKGVTHFFIRKEAQVHYLSFCDQLSSNLAKGAAAASTISVSQTLNFGEQTIAFFRSAGLSEDTLAFASGFVKNVQKVVSTLDQTNYDLKALLADAAAYEHGVSTSMISSMLLVPLGVSSDRPVETFGMAALLHDVGLYRLPEELRHEDMSKMTIEQQGVFKTHVGIGGQILSEMKGVHPAAIQGVEQHHARRGKQGFPSTVTGANLSLIGEITGMADELAHLIEGIKAAKPDFDPVAEMEKRLHGFSPKVAEAFRRAFVKRAARQAS